jgi:hypothetical protein
MAPAACPRIGREVHAVRVSARCVFVASGTLVVRIVVSQGAWSRCMTSCCLNKFSSLISDDKVDTPAASHSFSLISRSVSSSSYLIRTIPRT